VTALPARQVPARQGPAEPFATDTVDRALALAWCGPAEHGVTRLARQIADAAQEVGFGGTVLHEPDPGAVGALVDRLPSAVRLLHLHVNDWLFADQQAGADQRIAALAQRLNRRGMTLTVTLHDLPQVSDGAMLFRRRASTYRAIVRQTGGIVVSSRHERALLLDALADGPGMDQQRAAPGAEDTDVDVIPLPIDGAEPAAHPRTRSDTVPTVGIFGYLYPGKGHREVLDQLAGMRPAVTVLAIGRPSVRHAELLPELQSVAEHGGIGFRCTGYVADADVVQELRNVLVPLAPHTHVSASGSINSWIAAGRRPLVPAGRYVSELADRLPGSVCVYQPGELRQAVDRAIANPESTWLAAGFQAGPTTFEVASRYLGWLRRLAFTRP
jgi:hypothetical protein